MIYGSLFEIFFSIVSVLIGEEITWKAGDKRSLKYLNLK